MRLSAGQRVQNLVVVRALGEGAFGAVYQVRDPALGVDRALKVLHRSSPSATQRFRREARAQARLRHPHVVALHRLLAIEDGHALVLELVDGPSLRQLLDADALRQPHVAALARALFAAMAFAHDAGLLHRDLKPSNILCAAHGDRLVPKIADFGLVKLADDDGSLRTSTGTVMGTPAYMAPEQFACAQVDARADVYALGAILYEVLTGRRPHDGPTPMALLLKAGSGDHPRLTAMEGIPGAWAEAIERALAPEPDDRWPSVRAFWAAFDEVDPSTLDPLAATSMPGATLPPRVDARSVRSAEDPPPDGRVGPTVAPVAAVEDTYDPSTDADLVSVAATLDTRPRSIGPAFAATAVLSLLAVGGVVVAVAAVAAVAFGFMEVGTPIVEETPAAVEVPAPSPEPVAPPAEDPAVEAPEPIRPAPVAAPQPVAPRAPDPPEPTSGTLTVMSRPWSTVRVDGTDVGTSSADARFEVSSGPHDVELVTEGGDRWSTRVTVPAGEVVDLCWSFRVGAPCTR